jgi:hypothetical protein
LAAGGERPLRRRHREAKHSFTAHCGEDASIGSSAPGIAVQRRERRSRKPPYIHVWHPVWRNDWLWD